MVQCNLYLSFPDNSFSWIRRSISVVPERILFQLWLPHLLFSRIHCFFFRPPTKTMNRGFTVFIFTMQTPLDVHLHVALKLGIHFCIHCMSSLPSVCVGVALPFFFFSFSGWGETESTWYVGHCWPIVPAPDDR
jgi:hypothetical protein